MVCQGLEVHEGTQQAHFAGQQAALQHSPQELAMSIHHLCGTVVAKHDQIRRCIGKEAIPA